MTFITFCAWYHFKRTCFKRFCTRFQMKHRNFWGSSQTGNPSRCQTSTTTCLTCWTMKAACIPQCRLVLDVQEVRTRYTRCKFSKRVTALIYDTYFPSTVPVYSTQTWWHVCHYIMGKGMSQHAFRLWLVHNTFPLVIYMSKGIFMENFCRLEDTYNVQFEFTC